MQYFDMVQLGDAAAGLWGPNKFRRDPPLLRHAGNVSTKDAVERREAVALNSRFDAYKQNNPRHVYKV